MDHSAVTSIDVTFEMSRIAVAYKFVHGRLCVNVDPSVCFVFLFFFHHGVLLRTCIRVNRGGYMLFGCWASCKPSCEDVHNSLNPPGTLYFHGPASDVNAPAVLWIVRTDYSVGGEGTGSLCGVSAACDVCVYVDVSMLVCVCVCVFMCAYDL